MMHCGSPNGYPIVTFRGNQYSMRFRVPRRPSSDQMHLIAPNEIVAGNTGKTTVLANIYWGNKRSKVEMRVGDQPWCSMALKPQKDPFLQKIIAQGHPLSTVKHMWAANLPADLPVGGHTVEVRTVDMYGQTFFGAADHPSHLTARVTLLLHPLRPVVLLKSICCTPTFPGPWKLQEIRAGKAIS